MKKRTILLSAIVALDSFKSLSAQSTQFTDGAGVVLARNLEHVSPKIFEQKFPELTFLQAGIDVDNSGGYADIITKRKQTVNADLNFGGSDRGANKGKISISREKDGIMVFGDRRFSEWTETELKQAQHENVNIVTEYIKGHNTVYQNLIDRAGYLGVEGNKGLLNYPFASTTAADSIGNLTAKQMYDEFAGLITDQWNGVNNTMGYMANTVVTSPIVINKITKTMLSTTGDSTKSVMAALQDNFAGIKFIATALAYDGTSSKAVAFSNSEDAMTFRVPQKLTIGEIIKRSSFTYEVESMFRVAGLDVAEVSAGRTLLGL